MFIIGARAIGGSTGLAGMQGRLGNISPSPLPAQETFANQPSLPLGRAKRRPWRARQGGNPRDSQSAGAARDTTDHRSWQCRRLPGGTATTGKGGAGRRSNAVSRDTFPPTHLASSRLPLGWRNGQKKRTFDVSRGVIRPNDRSIVSAPVDAMQAHPLLAPCCWLLIVILTMTIIIPYLRGRSDLLTTWNIFLLGAINFVGGAGLMAAYYPDFFRVLDYTRRDYEYFMLGIIVFFSTLLFTYYVVKFPRRIAGRVLLKWPPATDNVLCFMLIVSVGLSLLSIFPPRIIGITQVLMQLGNKAIVMAMVLSFVAWYRNLINPFLLLVFLATALFAMVFAIASGSGRRTMVGILIALPICLYWLRYRYQSPKKNLLYTSVFGAIALLVIGAYSQIRHFDRQGQRLDRSVSNSLEVLMTLPSLLGHFDTRQLVGQNAGQTSLAAIHLYTYDMDPEPFHAMKFVLAYPFPRAFWPNKPVGLGFTLPKDCKATRTRATWGPGIVGHGFHEGGLHMLFIYAVLAALGLRYFDELLARQPNNPYLLGTMSAMAGHVFGWTRGDIGTFTNQIVTSYVLCLLFCYAGRMVFGTGVEYPRAGETPLQSNVQLPAWNQHLPEQG